MLIFHLCCFHPPWGLDQGMDAGKKKFPAGMRVLAVDDDRFCLMVTQLMLKKCEYEGEGW
jgi:hypothetical protein